MVKINWFSFEQRLSIINNRWQNQNWHETLSHKAGTDPARIPVY